MVTWIRTKCKDKNELERIDCAVLLYDATIQSGPGTWRWGTISFLKDLQEF